VSFNTTAVVWLQDVLQNFSWRCPCLTQQDCGTQAIARRQWENILHLLSILFLRIFHVKEGLPADRVFQVDTKNLSLCCFYEFLLVFTSERTPILTPGKEQRPDPGGTHHRSSCIQRDCELHSIYHLPVDSCFLPKKKPGSPSESGTQTIRMFCRTPAELCWWEVADGEQGWEENPLVGFAPGLETMFLV